jgi:hypothetical protein
MSIEDAVILANLLSASEHVESVLRYLKKKELSGQQKL